MAVSKREKAVEVTGIVRKNGRDYGWYRISYNGGAAYVSAKHLSSKKPGGSNREDSPDLDTQDPLAGYVTNSDIYENPPDLDTQDPLASDPGDPPDYDTQDSLAGQTT